SPRRSFSRPSGRRTPDPDDPLRADLPVSSRSSRCRPRQISEGLHRRREPLDGPPPLIGGQLEKTLAVDAAVDEAVPGEDILPVAVLIEDTVLLLGDLLLLQGSHIRLGRICNRIPDLLIASLDRQKPRQ